MNPDRCPLCGSPPSQGDSTCGKTGCWLQKRHWSAVQQLKDEIRKADDLYAKTFANWVEADDERDRLKADRNAARNENARLKAALVQMEQDLWAAKRVEA